MIEFKGVKREFQGLYMSHRPVVAFFFGQKKPDLSPFFGAAGPDFVVMARTR
jgi:hypothetical protein